MNPSDSLRPTFNEHSAPEQKANQAELPAPQHETLGIASYERVEELLGQISKPRVVHDYTPLGTVVQMKTTENDQRIFDEVRDMLMRLEHRQRQALDAFKKANDTDRGEHLRPRQKMSK
jgi:hypothetical protein